MGYIYALCEPETSEVRYVGKTTTDPLIRYSKHLSSQSLCAGTWKSNWIKSLVESGRLPNLLILEECNDSYLSEKEVEWISKYSAFGRLTNATKGGDGGNTNLIGRKHTLEWKRSLSERNSGSGNPFYGKKHSAEAVSRIVIKNTGRKQSQHHKDTTGIAARNKQPKYGYFGVSPSICKGKWRARFYVDGKFISCGNTFETREDAALVYDREVVKWVSNPPLNFERKV